MISEEEFKENLKRLFGRIEKACECENRNPDDISILPVTKNWPIEAVQYSRNAGFNRVGENRVQEAIEKQNNSILLDMNWDLIGHLQSNKVRWIPGNFARVQTVDSIKLIKKLEKILNHENKKLGIFLQVNTGKDPAKAGIFENQCEELVDVVLNSNFLNLEGFMTIAPYAPDEPSIARLAFSRLRNLRDRISENYHIEIPELSMGMSEDLREAIAEGSTMIRVGSALFGTRD